MNITGIYQIYDPETDKTACTITISGMSIPLTTYNTIANYIVSELRTVLVNTTYSYRIVSVQGYEVETDDNGGEYANVNFCCVGDNKSYCGNLVGESTNNIIASIRTKMVELTNISNWVNSYPLKSVNIILRGDINE